MPALYGGHVTFGSLNQPAKIRPERARVWAKILRRVPGSRLLMKYSGLIAGSSTVTHYRELTPTKAWRRNASTFKASRRPPSTSTMAAFRSTPLPFVA